ncbi:MAG: transporter [Deltaproteobacteria bacterium]|nr:transporter [Deltaproteobacteria bacterium]
MFLRDKAEVFPVRASAAGFAVCGLLASMAALPSSVHAHGETVRGGGAGGINTVGAIVTPGILSGGLRLEVRQFDAFSEEMLLGYALEGEDVHQHAQELSGTLTASYALDASWCLNAALQVNAFRDFREATLDGPGVARVVRDDLSGGIGDLLLLTRVRPWHDDSHHVAILAGLKLPTGSTRETDDEGARQGAHNQPGSGSIDFQLGLAYSLVVDWFEIDADVVGHVRTEGAMSYQAGNMLQADVALSATVWQLTLVAELNFLVAERDVERDEVLRNSGITTLYASPGVVARLTSEHVLFASFSYPIYQDLPGIQNNELFRANLGYAFSAEVSRSHDGERRPTHDPFHPQDDHPPDRHPDHGHAHDGPPHDEHGRHLDVRYDEPAHEEPAHEESPVDETSDAPQPE